MVSSNQGIWNLVVAASETPELITDVGYMHTSIYSCWCTTSHFLSSITTPGISHHPGIGACMWHCYWILNQTHEITYFILTFKMLTTADLCVLSTFLRRSCSCTPAYWIIFLILKHAYIAIILTVYFVCLVNVPILKWRLLIVIFSNHAANSSTTKGTNTNPLNIQLTFLRWTLKSIRYYKV